MVITDSGGIQKEGYFSKKRVLLLYPYTPWPELEKIGFLRKVDPYREEFSPTMLDWKAEKFENIFGDGNSSPRIVNRIMEAL